MPRYFQSELANRPLVLNGRTYTFDLVSRNLGTFKAETDQQIADLASAVGRLGVSEITPEDFEKLQAQKKTTPGSNPSGSLRSVRPVVQSASRLPTTPIAERQGVAYAANDPKPEPKEEADTGKLPAVADLIEVGPVASPSPVKDSERVGGSAKKSRAKASK